MNSNTISTSCQKEKEKGLQYKVLFKPKEHVCGLKVPLSRGVSPFSWCLGECAQITLSGGQAGNVCKKWADFLAQNKQFHFRNLPKKITGQVLKTLVKWEYIS